MESTTTKTAESKRSMRRIRRGTVVTDMRDKTVKIVYQYSRKHPKYGKFLRRRTTMHVHDEKNEARIGDVVEVMACRPVSKQKSWRLLRIIERPPGRE